MSARGEVTTHLESIDLLEQLVASVRHQRELQKEMNELPFAEKVPID